MECYGNLYKEDKPRLLGEKFMELAEKAKANCPISKLLNAEITLDATFKS